MPESWPRKAWQVARRCGELDERQTARHLEAVGRPQPRQAVQTVAFGFAADQKEVQVGTRGEALEQRGPSGFRPVLPFAAAARVDRQRRGQGRARRPWRAGTGGLRTARPT